MNRGGGKATAAFFDSVSVAGAPRTITQLFKSGPNCVHEWAEGLALSLLLLHLWPGKVTSVAKSTPQTWFEKYQKGGAVFIFKGFALSCFFSNSTAMLTACFIKQVPGEQASSRKFNRATGHIFLHQG